MSDDDDEEDRTVRQTYTCCGRVQTFEWDGTESRGYACSEQILCVVCEKQLAVVRCDLGVPWCVKHEPVQE